MGTPSSCSGRSWRMGTLLAPPPMHLSTMVPRFPSRPYFLLGIPARVSPHSCPFYCIRAANCISLPGSVLPTPCFSHPTMPASADSPPRQGHPGLIPKEVLGWAVLMPLEPTQAEATLAQGLGGSSQVGAPPNACRG